MRYRVTLAATQCWVVVVDAADMDDAMREAKIVYEASSNPWEDLESIGDEKVDISTVSEMSS